MRPAYDAARVVSRRAASAHQAGDEDRYKAAVQTSQKRLY
jgi:hypothetical protein